MATVHVGPDGGLKKKFQVYRGLLCFHSSYFDRLLNGQFREGGSNYIRLNDTTVEIFQAFFFWLNTGKLCAPAGDKIPLSTQTIAQIYVFGDSKLIPRLKNAALELFVAKAHEEWMFPRNELDYIYGNTTENCGLRRFMVEFAVNMSRWEDLDGYRHLYPKDFLVDVLVTMRGKTMHFGTAAMSKVRWIAMTQARMCRYHDHTEPIANAQKE